MQEKTAETFLAFQKKSRLQKDIKEKFETTTWNLAKIRQDSPFCRINKEVRPESGAFFIFVDVKGRDFKSVNI